MKKMRDIKYKGISVGAFGLPRLNSFSKPPVQKPTKRIFHATFLSIFEKDATKNLIVIYDIPEEKKKERDWFRRHLKKFNYVMIQRSVWVGPSPLPKDFLNYVKSIGLKDKLKTFKLAKPYSENSNNID